MTDEEDVVEGHDGRVGREVIVIAAVVVSWVVGGALTRGPQALGR